VAETHDRPWFVQDDEHIELTAKPGDGYVVALFLKLAVPWTVLASIGYALLDVLLVTTWPVVASGYAGYVMPPYVVGLVAMAVFAWRRQVTSLYVVTDNRLYATRGRLRQRLDFTSHDRVSDVHYNRGIWDRLTGVGDVRFATAGENVNLPGVTDPARIQSAATNARDAFVEELLERAGLEGQTGMARAPQATVEPAVDTPTETDAEPAPPTTSPSARNRSIDPEAEGLTAYEGPAPDYVQGRETVRWMGHPSKMAMLQDAAGGVLGLAFVALFFLPGLALSGTLGQIALPAAIVFFIAPIVYQYLRLDRTELAVTDQRVYLRTGVLATNVKQVAYEKITDIAYNEPLLGHVFGYAGIEVNTSGSTTTPIQVTGLVEALAVKRLVEKAAEADDA